ncbi:MAG: GNAT family N-acetyltransferase [Actinobacteria bacterium]|nr:MAG: GNAT family N-acetyltransferase [Actinomycetota bacterium]
MAGMSDGRRVSLRRVEPSDYEHILRWQNDPTVFRWMDYTRMFSLADIKESEERAAAEGHPFVIEAEGRPVGRIGLNNFRPRDRLASLYIFVGDRDVQGKGYGREALTLLLAYAFDTLNLRMVELWTLGDNERAVHLYKRCGFTEEARLRDRSWVEGAYVDHLIMSIDAEEFARVRADRSNP